MDRFYNFSETLITNFSSFVDFLSTEVVGDFTILEVILGVGTTAFVGFTIAKWIIDFIP